MSQANIPEFDPVVKPLQPAPAPAPRTRTRTRVLWFLGGCCCGGITLLLFMALALCHLAGHILSNQHVQEIVLTYTTPTPVNLYNSTALASEQEIAEVVAKGDQLEDFFRTGKPVELTDHELNVLARHHVQQHCERHGRTDCPQVLITTLNGKEEGYGQVQVELSAPLRCMKKLPGIGKLLEGRYVHAKLTVTVGMPEGKDLYFYVDEIEVNGRNLLADFLKGIREHTVPVHKLHCKKFREFPLTKVEVSEEGIHLRTKPKAEFLDD